MQIPKGMKPWAPVGAPDLLTLIPKEAHPPDNLETYLLSQGRTLAYLVEQANPGEVEAANHRLADNLPWEFRQFLPANPLDKPHWIFNNPETDGGKISEFKAEARRLLNGHSMAQAQANELASELSLESFLSRLI